jgi:hypothetical protein
MKMHLFHARAVRREAGIRLNVFRKEVSLPLGISTPGSAPDAIWTLQFSMIPSRTKPLPQK